MLMSHPIGLHSKMEHVSQVDLLHISSVDCPTSDKATPQDHTTGGQATATYSSGAKLVRPAASTHEIPPNAWSDFSDLSPIYFPVYGDFLNFSCIRRFYFSLLFQLHVSLTL